MYRVVASVLLVLVMGSLYYVNEVAPAQSAAHPQSQPSAGGLTADEKAMKNLKID